MEETVSMVLYVRSIGMLHFRKPERGKVRADEIVVSDISLGHANNNSRVW